MPRITNIYRLPYFQEGETTSGISDRIRFTTIDKQLESLFTFLGNGIISGWDISQSSSNSAWVTISSGSAVISSIAAANSTEITIDTLEKGRDVSTPARNNIYAKLLSHTPYTATIEFISTTSNYEAQIYLKIGVVTVASTGAILSIDTSEASGRKNLTYIRYILSILQSHLHTGEAGQPDKIDLQNHVKGVLSSANIENFSASKITSGIISQDRFQISHTNLRDIGTLTHAELDSLIGQFQTINRALFGDVLSTNLIQLFLSLKHTYSDLDKYFANSINLIPGVANNTALDANTFIDIGATTAEVDYINGRIVGKVLDAEEVGQIALNTVAELSLGEYDPNYILIKALDMAYGYGYGYGSGLDYFDVFQAIQTNTFGVQFLTGFYGSNLGYGISNWPNEDDFETIFADQYAFGYGWEYATGFPGTLFSSTVTLNPLSVTTTLHDKKLYSGASGGNTYDDEAENAISIIQLDGGVWSVPTSEPGIDLLLTAVGENADRSSNIPTSTANMSSLSYKLQKTLSSPSRIIVETFIGCAYEIWDIPVDLTTDNTIYFSLTEKTPIGTNNNFKNWTYNYNMGLILEFTVNDIRYYYEFKKDGDDNYIFFTEGDTPFSDVDRTGSNPATITKEATITVDDLDPICKYDTEGANDNPFGFPTPTAGDPATTTILQYLTGIIFYSKNDPDSGWNYYFDNYHAQIEFPQGTDSTMLADIDRIHLGGSYGYGDNIANNSLSDLEINFPTEVDFNSISWLSDEPADSIIYLQIALSGAASYDLSPVYTSDSDNLTSRAIFDSSTFLESGSNLPDSYKNITGMKIKAVLLPSLDKKISPMLNSIIINYTSRTVSDSLVISGQDAWESARKAENLKVDNDGNVTIDLPATTYGKLNNIIYGTDRSVVELNSDWGTVVKRYTGANLPQTVKQSLNNESSGIAGYVTDLKKMDNGDIFFLDRESSRIVRVDSKYNLKSIVASEYVHESINSGKLKLMKAIYNREIGNNGVLYLVFNHETKAWASGTGAENITKDNIILKSNKITDIPTNLGAVTQIIACDRGVLCFVLTANLSNYIESLTKSYIEIQWRQDNSDIIKFNFDTTGNVEEDTQSVEIEKIGKENVFDSNYFLMYAPINGIVAFDIDSEDRYLILKKTNPAHNDTIWYARFDPATLWTSWGASDSDLETNEISFNVTTIRPPTNPNFLLSAYYGYKGSIQRIGNLLLIVIPGDRKIYIMHKSSGKFNIAELSMIDDITYPAAARFDPKTVEDDDYTYIYVALSDLRFGTTDNTGYSKVAKVRYDKTTSEWKWGAGSDEGDYRIVSANDVRPLSLSTGDSVIVST